ncbi:MAG: hypothetical protein ACI88H_003930, partial [Cocleimonas sp.]
APGFKNVKISPRLSMPLDKSSTIWRNRSILPPFGFTQLRAQAPFYLLAFDVV